MHFQNLESLLENARKVNFKTVFTFHIFKVINFSYISQQNMMIRANKEPLILPSKEEKIQPQKLNQDNVNIIYYFQWFNHVQ